MEALHAPSALQAFMTNIQCVRSWQLRTVKLGFAALLTSACCVDTQSSLQSSGLRMWRVEGSGFWSFSFRLQAFRLHLANAQSPIAHLLAHAKSNPGKDFREHRSSMFRKEICRYFDVRNTTCSSFMWEPLERIRFYGE